MTSPGGKEVGRISIRVVPDTSLFRKELAAELESIEKSMKATIPVELDLDSGGAKAKFDVLLAELKAKGAKGVTIETKVDSDGLGKLFSGIGSGAGGAAGGLGGMGHGLAIVAAVAAFAAPALALVSGALATIPALAASLIVPIGAIALGLDGIKEAAQTLKPEFDNLKSTMSAKFKDVFTPIFKDMKQVFPALEEKLPGVATALGTVAKSFTDVITSDEGLKSIKGTIQNISDTITASAPGLGKLTDGFLNLANKVSAKFPAVGTWLDKVGTSFDNWVTKMSTVDASGTSPLDRAMDNLGGTLKGVLDIIGDLAKQGFDFLQDPEFGQKMKDFVEDCKTLLNDVLPGLKTAFMEIAGYVSTITDALDKINKVKLPDWATGGDQKKKDNGPGGFPGVEPDAWKFPDGKTFADKFKEQFKSAFNTNGGFGDILNNDVISRPPDFSGITNAWNATVSWMKTTWGQFTGYFAQQGSVIASAASQVWGTISGGFSTAWNAVTGLISSAVSNIGGLFSGIPAALSSAWGSLAGIASAAWAGVVSITVNILTQLVVTVVTQGAQIVSFFQELPGKITAALGSLDLSGVGRAIIDGLLAGIRAGVDNMIAFVRTIAKTIADNKGPLPYDRKVLTPAGEALMEGLSTGLENGLSPILQQAKDMATQIFQAFKDVFGKAPDGVSFNLGGATSGGGPLGTLPAQMSNLSSTSADFSKNMTSGVAGVGKLTDETKQQTADLQAQIDTLELQRKSLAVQKDQAGDKGTKTQLQQQIDALNVQKRQLDLQKGQLTYNDKYNGSLTESNTQLQDMAKKGQSLLTNFAKANTDQLMSDLGIGGGAITGGLQAGLDWGTQFASQFVFNVSNTDDAIAVKNNQLNKQSMQYQGR